jgi:hypothetical protein
MVEGGREEGPYRVAGFGTRIRILVLLENGSLVLIGGKKVPIQSTWLWWLRRTRGKRGLEVWDRWVLQWGLSRGACGKSLGRHGEGC